MHPIISTTLNILLQYPRQISFHKFNILVFKIEDQISDERENIYIFRKIFQGFAARGGIKILK